MNFETLETRNLMSVAAASIDAVPQTPAIVMSQNAGTSNQAIQSTGLTTEEKRVVELMTRTFENSSLAPRYDFCSDIEDGRGLTAGRAGFCSATTDMYMVVSRYNASHPNSILAKYESRLKELNDAAIAGWSGDDSEAQALGYADCDAASAAAGSTAGLEGMAATKTNIGDWARAAQDAGFCQVQDQVVDELYYQPAMQHAQQLGLQTAIAKGQLYDAILQHGDGSDHDGLSAMIDRATQRSGGSPATGISEKTWLTNFLNVRLETLSNAQNPDTRQGWLDSVDRVKVYQSLLSQNNMELTGTITFTVYGDTFTITPSTQPAPAPTPAGAGKIAGTIFLDSNQDGLWSEGENGNAASRIVFLDTNNNGVRDAGEQSTTTDSDGYYEFDNVATGNYTVRLKSSSQFFSTTPISQQATVAAGQETDVMFGEATTRHHR